MSDEKVYKILLRSEWERAGDEVPWSDDDARDGFMHLSAESQVRGTVDKHFRGKGELVLLRLDAAQLRELKWEPSRGGELFPHVHGLVPRSAVLGEESFETFLARVAK